MKTLYTILFFTISFFISAQEANKFRFGIDTGLVPSKGFTVGIEPKFNISDIMNVGLKISTGSFTETINECDFTKTQFSIMGTYDYYFDVTNSRFVPFAGAGLGIAGTTFDKFDTSNSADSSGFSEMIRLGFEFGKFRLALSYDIVPSTTIQSSYYDSFLNQTITTDYTIKNSYFGISTGFYFGGGKW